MNSWNRGGRVLSALLILLLLPANRVYSQRDSAIPTEPLRHGTRVEIDGIWKGRYLDATKLVVEGPANLEEIKGHPTEIRVQSGIIIMPPFTVEVSDLTDIEDDKDEGDSYFLSELRTEWHLKIEGKLIGPRRFRADEISVDRNKRKNRLEIEAHIESDEFDANGIRVITLLGVPCRITSSTEIVDKIRLSTGPKRRINIEEVRPSDQLVVFDRIVVGGEVQVDFDYRDDFDLDKHDNEDTFVFDTSTNLELTFDLGEAGYAFAKGRSAKSYVIYDEDRDLKLEERTLLEELYVSWRLPLQHDFVLQIGRQDFDDSREWIYDENIDAVRLYTEIGPIELQYSWSTFLADARRSFRERTNQILFVRYPTGKDSYLGAYLLDIRDGANPNDSPFYVGVRALKKGKTLRYWFDYVYQDGVLGTQEVEAHALDVGGGRRLSHLPLSPYFYASYAFGSGDGKTSGTTSRTFRQNGYADNNDRIFGVASFRYYGELLRPELSNLHIYTVGFGILPSKKTSVDLLYHRYTQDVRAATLANAKLRQSPSGLSRDIGEEIDLVFGLDKMWGHFDIELDVGYFIPGSAYATNDHPALFIAVQLEWNF